jgi:beta-lactamase class A
MELVAFPLGSRIPDAAALRARVETALAPLLAGTQARVAISLRLADGKVVLEREAERVQPSASIIKLPILFTLLEQVAQGHSA